MKNGIVFAATLAGSLELLHLMCMTSYRPQAVLQTHEVTNQPPPLVDFNAYEVDRALKDAVSRASGGVHEDRLRAFGAQIGRAETIEWGRLANENPPTLRSFDRFGHRSGE